MTNAHVYDMPVPAGSGMTREDVCVWNKVAARVWTRNMHSLPSLRPRRSLYTTSIYCDNMDAVLMQIWEMYGHE